MAPATGAGSSRCAQRRGPLSPWPPARSRRLPSSPHRRPDADSATPLAREAAPARGGGGGGRPGEGSSGTEAERGRKGGGAVGNGGAQGRGRPRSNPSRGFWRTTKATGTAWLGAWSYNPPRTRRVRPPRTRDDSVEFAGTSQSLQRPELTWDIGRVCSC